MIAPINICMAKSKEDLTYVQRFNGKPVADGSIQTYAHRASRGLLPEQTMPAYIETLRLGTDYVDMDLGMTKDGVLVITHDLGLNPNLTRDKDDNWITEAIPINSLTLKELQTYNVGKLKPGTEYGSFFPYQHSVDTKIPTLKSVVEYVKSKAGKNVGFQFEIKNDPTKPNMTPSPKEFASAIYKLMKEEDIIDITEIQSFDWRPLIELKKLDSSIKIAALSDHTTEVMTDDEPGTWMAGMKPKDYNYSLPQMVKALGADCWEPFEGDLTKNDLDEARKLGLKVVVWGWPEVERSEFDYQAVQKMIDWKVDGIITDRPDILRGLLMSRSMYLPKSIDK